ncbi:hypothetical protein D3C71_1804370 [compost metagenome]
MCRGLILRELPPFGTELRTGCVVYAVAERHFDGLSDGINGTDYVLGPDIRTE